MTHQRALQCRNFWPARAFCGMVMTGLLLCSATAASAQNEPSAVLERLRKGGPLVIAHRESALPFSYVDANGKPMGYAVELCQKLAESLRKTLKLSSLPLRYVQVTPSSRIETIVKGEADMECGSTTNNAERREKVAFTVPHYITGARFLVRSDSNVGDLTGFEGKRLVSTKGTTPLKAVIKANLERLLRINVIEAPEHARAMAMVAKGEADGFVMDDVLLYGLIAGQPEPGKFKVVGKLLTIEPLAIMLPKGDAAYKRLIDEEMKRLIRSNEAVAIYERWFLQPIPPKGTALNLPMNYLLRDFWKYPTDVVPF
jgi:ABC-type amino acid transport substrate-binding protein